MNIAAGSHFARGQRAFFFALAYLGWFVSPWLLMLATTAVVLVMWRRQFASRIRARPAGGRRWNRAGMEAMTIPKKPTRQRTSSPKKPAQEPKPAPKPAPPAVKATGRPERGGPSEEDITESILRLVAARGPGKTSAPPRWRANSAAPIRRTGAP